ncbi:hypothetical protein Tco_0100859, partial [Tanacetum coccineum]
GKMVVLGKRLKGRTSKGSTTRWEYGGQIDSLIKNASEGE